MATKIFKFLAAVFAVSFLVAPVFAFADTGVAVDRVAPEISFCSNLSTFSSTVNARLSMAQTNLNSRQTQRNSNVTNREAKRTKELTDLRAAQDSERIAIYAKLGVKATTTSETQAVAEFKATIEAAVTVRRAAVNAAMDAYGAGLDSVLQARQAAVQTARQNLNASILAAITAAQKACSDGTASATVRANFAASVKAAQTQFITDRKAIDKAGPQIKALAKTRNAAVKKAMDDFHTAAENARVELKAAFST